MNLKRIKGEMPAERLRAKTWRDEIVYTRGALRFQLIRNYVILIDLIRKHKRFAFIFHRPNYISIQRFFALRYAPKQLHLENYRGAQIALIFMQK